MPIVPSYFDLVLDYLVTLWFSHVLMFVVWHFFVLKGMILV